MAFMHSLSRFISYINYKTFVNLQDIVFFSGISTKPRSQASKEII